MIITKNIVFKKIKRYLITLEFVEDIATVY